MKPIKDFYNLIMGLLQKIAEELENFFLVCFVVFGPGILATFLLNDVFYILMNIDILLECLWSLTVSETIPEVPVPDLDPIKDISEPDSNNEVVFSEIQRGWLRFGACALFLIAAIVLSKKPANCSEILGHWTVEQNLITSEYAGVAAFMIVAIIVALLITAASFVLVTQLPEVEKLTPYECGFEAYEAPRVQFDIKFCVVAILLILFDVEMMYVFPWCISICKLPALGVWSMIDFLLTLGFG